MSSPLPRCAMAWHILNISTHLHWGKWLWSSAAGPPHLTIICPINNRLTAYKKSIEIKQEEEEGCCFLPLCVSDSQSVDQTGRVIKSVILITNGWVTGETYCTSFQQQKPYVYLYINVCICAQGTNENFNWLLKLLSHFFGEFVTTAFSSAD